MSDFKSHTEEECQAALAKGEPVWALDTNTSGEDDTLIGPYDEVLADLLAHHELTALPERWSLEPWEGS